MHIWEDIELRNVRKSEKGQKFAEVKIKKKNKEISSAGRSGFNIGLSKITNLKCQNVDRQSSEILIYNT